MIRSMSAFIAALALSAPALDAQEKITLQQKYVPGKYELKQVMTSQAETTIRGQMVPTDMSMTMVMEIVVQAPDDKGLTKVQMGFRQVKQKVSQSGKAMMEYDSENPGIGDQSEALGRMYKPLLAAKIAFQVTKEGKIQNFSGLEEIWDNMAKEDPNLAEVAEEMKKQINNSMVEKMMSQASKSFPDKPVGVGDTWKVETKMTVPMVGEMVVNQDCKLKDVEKSGSTRLAVVEIEAKAKADKPVENKTRRGTMTVEKMQTAQKGTMKVDVDKGIAVQQNWDGTVDMEMTTVGRDGESTPISSKQKLKMEITMTVKP
jgi:hypothetical protein